jgi:hypothetical protein
MIKIGEVSLEESLQSDDIAKSARNLKVQKLEEQPNQALVEYRFLK